MSDAWEDDDNEAGSSLTSGAQFFDRAGSGFRSLGLDTAADNLARYRGGSGGTHVYPHEEIERHRPLLRYEDENRTLFEAFSFVGENNRGRPTDVLQTLGDGETTEYQDRFTTTRIPHRLSTHLAFGRTGVLSQLNPTATRNGDDILIEGEVTHDFNGGNGQPGELFDFNPGQPGRVSAIEAEAAGEARPFTMRMDRRQTVSALARREPDGLLTLRRVQWGPIR